MEDYSTSIITDPLRRCERALHNCQEVNREDYVAYPLVDEIAFSVMEQEYLEDTSVAHVYPFARKNDNGIFFVDIYVWDVMLYPKEYSRFVITDGFRMSSEEENLFFQYLRSEFISWDEREMQQFNDRMQAMKHKWHYQSYSQYDMRHALEHIYFASHISGIREILYKADLNNIAYHIEKIASCNLIGSTPESIIGYGVTNRLLRILNQEAMLQYLFDESKMKSTLEVYKMYTGYIGQRLPSHIQWQYLEKLYYNNGYFYGYKFVRALYDRLYDADKSDLLDDYGRFLQLRDELTGIGRLRWPKAWSVTKDVQRLEKLLKYRKENLDIDNRIAVRRKWAPYYEFEGDKYIITMPASVMDFYKEAVSQRNCLMDYVEEHAYRNTTILFIRRKEASSESYVTIEVKDSEILQVYGKNDSFPPIDVYEFLKKYAQIRWFYYDIYELIMNDPEEAFYQCDPKLVRYAEEYREKYYCDTQSESSEEEYSQMTIEDYLLSKTNKKENI